MHGANWPAVRERYRPLLEHVGHRADLNYVLAEMIGELVVGHAYVGGGDTPDTDSVPVGLLGCDFEIEDGRYRIAKIYTGHNWNPELRAPLTEPGVDVKEGDWLLAVNGRPLDASVNVYSLFEETSGKMTDLLVNANPTEEGARTETVVPISSETGLRNRDWVEGNREKVEKLSNGRLAYVYMPNTSGAGYTYFNRYYYTGIGKEGAVIDERDNGGGSAADYIVDMLDRPLLNWWATREGKMFTTPTAAIFGPKVMVINEYAGSGGDAMPYYFRKRGIGKLVGTTTWGGLVGIYDYPPLIDGGFITAPRVAIVSTDGEWVVENVGVPPDVEVVMYPKEVIAGQDPQLEKAVEILMAELGPEPAKPLERPAPPNRVE
jgi:tricorn protease